jgi:hypothetical protein
MFVDYGTDYPDPLAEDGAALLDDVREFISRFCVFPSEHALTAVTVWAAHAHMIEHFHTTPRLAFLSPEPESGKSRSLEVLDLLTPDPMLIFNASPAAIFRTLANKQVTLLFDEVDAVFSKRGKDDNNEDLRALLNVGYRHGATVPRCVGPRHDVEHFPAFAATALAGLGDLPETIMTRSVVIRMRRRAPSERKEDFRLRQHEAPGHELRDRLRSWADEVAKRAGDAWPNLPAGVVDRAAECWEPLLAVADQAGGHWPQSARTACVELCKVVADRQASLGVRLLEDLRVVFTVAGDEALSTETLLRRLNADESYGSDIDGPLTLNDSPWSDLRGKPLDSRGLARLLRRYEVEPVKVKVEIDGKWKSLQGYRREHLWDVWTRYLSPAPAETEPPEPAERSRSEPYAQVPLNTQIPEPPREPAPSNPALNSTVPQVPLVPDTQVSTCPDCFWPLDSAGHETICEVIA